MEFERQLTEEQKRRMVLDEKCYMSGQSHFTFFLRTDLSDDGKNALLDFIEKTDLKEQREYFFHAKNTLERSNKIFDFHPPSPPTGGKEDYCTMTKFDRASPADQATWRTRGLQEVANGHVALVILAGGQGTRLGFSGPKGMLPVGPVSKKSIFQILVERLTKLVQIAAESIPGSRPLVPLYVLTSEMNHKQTEDFFREHKNFGYPHSITFFQQQSLPCVDTKGVILMETKTKPIFTPNGNGGVFEALVSSGCLNDMQSKGVTGVHVVGVDNILVKVLDPSFIGYAALSNADVVNKCVERTQPNEAVGVYCKQVKKPPAVPITGIKLKPEVPHGAVIEYTELPDALAKARVNGDSSQPLQFNAANICNHFFKVDFIKRLVDSNHLQRRYHLAAKKIPSLDVEAVEGGNFYHVHGYRNLEDIQIPNGYKLELFVFDSFSFAKKVDCLLVSREDEFAPVKNAEGRDSVATAQNLMSSLHKKWLTVAGVELTGDGLCEVSPTVSYSGEGIQGKCNEIAVTLPYHLY